MQFPLTLRFKLFAISPIIEVNDAAGNTVCFVKQKLFRLKERVEVFTDDSKSSLLCEINADKIIDWSASYSFTDPNGNAFGSVKRQGARSLWKASYQIFVEGEQKYQVSEENPWAKVGDAVLEMIPLVEFFAGYLFQPRYGVVDSNGTTCYRLIKEKSFREAKFTIEEVENRDDDITVVMSLLMMTLLERQRS